MSNGEFEPGYSYLRRITSATVWLDYSNLSTRVVVPFRKTLLLSMSWLRDPKPGKKYPLEVYIQDSLQPTETIHFQSDDYLGIEVTYNTREGVRSWAHYQEWESMMAWTRSKDLL